MSVLFDIIMKEALSEIPADVKISFSSGLNFNSQTFDNTTIRRALLYADDIALIASDPEILQQLVNKFVASLNDWGFDVSIDKCVIKKFGSAFNNSDILINERKLEVVDNFKYLGSVIEGNGGSDLEVKSRISSLRASFRRNYDILTDKVIDVKIRCRLYKLLVLPCLLYCTSTLAVTKSSVSKMQVAVNHHLRIIHRFRWFDKISNDTLWLLSEIDPIDALIRRERLNFLGHLARRPIWSKARQLAIASPLDSKRKKGGHAKSWNSLIKDDLRMMNVSGDVSGLASNNSQWKDDVKAAANNCLIIPRRSNRLRAL
jgi:hypothetical protein